MRDLYRNKRTIYYALYQSKADVVDANGYKTGEKTLAYGTPTAFKANVSAALGNANVAAFGVNTNYSRTITTTDMGCPIDTESKLWVDVPTSAPYDYKVVSVSRSLNSITYAIREVSRS